MRAFEIAGRVVAAGRPCLVVGEVAQAHEGSVGMAHAFIDAVAAAGADAVKFQTHIAEAESTPEEPWRTRPVPQDASRYDYWKRMEFTEDEWRSLARHSSEKGLIFLSSPFSIEAVELLLRVGAPAWKVASGELTNIPMLQRMAETKLPVIFSSGMSSLAELDAAVGHVRDKAPIAMLQCTTVYPCPPEKVGLNLLGVFRERYGCPVGLSDHSGHIFPALAGAALGMEILELHVALSREMFGADVIASVTTAELRQVVDGIRFIEKMRAHPLDKDAVAREMVPLKRIFNKSVVARADLPAGTVLREDLLTVKKPGTGIPAEHFYRLIGRRLRRKVAANHFLAEEDLESPVTP